MPLGTWLLGMMGGMTAKVLLALGFSVVSIVGVDAAFNQLRDLAMSHVGGIPAAGLNLALLAGCGQAAGIIFGACATRLALWQIANAKRILGA